MSIRVAYLCEHPTLLGGERSLLTFLDHCGETVDPIALAPAEGRLAEEFLRRGVRHVVWSAEVRSDAEEIANRLSSERIDVIHANSLMVADAGIELGKPLRVPVVVHVRDMMSLSAGRRDRLKGADAIVAVSDAVKASLVEQGLPEGKVERIYNGVDVPELQRQAWQFANLPAQCSDGRTRLVGCIGQIGLRKGQDLFLDAATIVAKRFPAVSFLIVGERYSTKAESVEFEEALRRRAGEPPLRGRTYFLGYRDDVPAILAQLDVLVVPSRQEPLSRVLLEGLAVGTASVATEVGGMREIASRARLPSGTSPEQAGEVSCSANGDTIPLTDVSSAGVGPLGRRDLPECAVLVPPNDAAAMADGILRVLTDEVLRLRLQSAGPIGAAEFSPARNVAEIEGLYARLTAATSNPA